MFTDGDVVRLNKNKKCYADKGVYKGMVGFVITDRVWERHNLISFIYGGMVQDDEGDWCAQNIECSVHEDDLCIAEDEFCSKCGGPLGYFADETGFGTECFDCEDRVTTPYPKDITAEDK